MKKAMTILWVAALAGAILAATGASARVINVPDDYATIQGGIDAAEDGDTVLVAPGEYEECISFEGKDITLMGTPEDPSRTVIDGGGQGSVVTFNQGVSSDAVLSGFTIRNGNGQDGGGIDCYRSSPTLSSLVITGNTAARGGGVFSYYSDIVLINVCLTQNTATESSGGAAAYIEGGDRVEMTNVLAAKNDAQDGEVGGITLYNVVQSYLQNVSIIDNTGAAGVALRLVASGYDVVTTMSNCIVWGRAGAGVDVMVDFHRGRSAALTVSYSDIQSGFIFPNGPNATVNWGDGWIDADPLFADPDSGDYHLTAESPCIDAGDPESDFDPDGTRADMGTFYFHQRDIEVEPDSLVFATLEPGSRDSLAITIRNIGLTWLQVELPEIAPADAPFTHSWDWEGPGDIPSESEYQFRVFFHPDAEAEYRATLTLISDDFDEDTVRVALSGAAVLGVADQQKLDTYEFGITSIHPNPFNAAAVASYELRVASRIRLALYDLNGRLTQDLFDGKQSAGKHQAVIDGALLPTGVYWLSLGEPGGQQSVAKVVLVR